MVARRLKSGATAYYWAIPSWAKKNGCILKTESLGLDYAKAKKRCDDLLNPQFDAWRKGEDASFSADRASSGTFDWMVAVYKFSPQYQKLPEPTRDSYDWALGRASKHELNDGRTFGQLSLKSITPGAADRLSIG